MSVLNALSAAIYSKLSGGAALTTLLGGAYIYHLQAPTDAALPYVVFSLQAGGPENITPSDMHNDVYFIRAYAASALVAGNIDAAISTLMQTVLTVTGYTNYALTREQDFALVENPPNKQPVFMAGAFYRIRLDS